jgi:hypothetical protein
MGLTKAQLEALNDSSFPNNNAGAITPAILRDYNDAVILNTVNQDTYTTDSASFDSRIDGLATTSSVNAISTSVGLLQTFSGSQYKADSASFSSRINSATGSSTNTGSLLLTASFDNGTRNLTFTKGDATTFNVNIPDVSGSTFDTGSLVTTASFNAYTASQDFKNTTFATTGSNTFTGQQTLSNTGDLQFPLQIISGGIRIDDPNTDWMIWNSITNGGLKRSNTADLELLAQSASLNILNSAGRVFVSGSTQTVIAGVDFIPFSSSLDSRIISATINTGSFATTGSNTFVGNQTINGDLSVSQSKFIRIGDNQSISTTFGNSLLIASQGGNLIRNDAGGGDIRLENSQGFIEVFSNTTVNISGSNTTIQNVDFIPFSSSLDSRILAAGGQPQVQEEGTILGNATSFNFIGAGVTATLSAGTASITIPGGGGSIDTGSFATTGSNTFTGNQTIEGAIVSNPTTSLTELFSQAFVSGAVQYNITASNATSQSNLVLGGTPLGSTSTGSVIISGSQNILFSPAKTLTGTAAFTNGYLGGSANIVVTIPTLHTQSLFSPTMNNNNINSAITFNFITSSTSVPNYTNNLNFNSVTINHQSASLTAQNNITNTPLTSTANITELTQNPAINGSTIIGGAVTLNHNSSSITYQQNIGGGITVTNNYSSSVSNAVNNINLLNNVFAGASNTLLVSGSNTANRRTFSQNIIAGNSNAISSDLIGSTGGHLIATAIIGQNLIVSASGTSTTAGGGAFFGRYNDITNLLADSGKTIFAVGTGTSTSNRKTALSIDSGSNVLISGSLIVANPSTSGFSVDANAVVSASKVYIGNQSVGVEFTPSTGSITDSYTRYGKDSFQIYQYQGQPYAFGVICTADQLNAYTGSQFRWGTVNGTGAIQNYMNMVSASYTGSIGAGTPIPGFDYLKDGQIVQFQRGTTFDKNVYIQQGLYVSQSVGGPTPALTLNGTNGSGALIASGSVVISGSLNLNGQNTFASLSTNTFGGDQIVSSSIYIAPNNNNNQLYLPSGSNKQTGLATLDGGNPGTVTVSNSNVTANSIILITKQTLAHPNGYVAVSSKGSGTFTITSNHNGDADVVGYMIINAS